MVARAVDKVQERRAPTNGRELGEPATTNGFCDVARLDPETEVQRLGAGELSTGGVGEARRIIRLNHRLEIIRLIGTPHTATLSGKPHKTGEDTPQTPIAATVEFSAWAT